MAQGTSATVGDRLECGGCGTRVRVRRVGGGRMECCDQPLTSAGGPAADAAAVGRAAGAHCSGCGNEVGIERDGGGDLRCCADSMVRG